MPQMVRFAMTARDHERKRTVAAEFYKNYDAGIDRAIARRMMSEFVRLAPEGTVPDALSALFAAHGGAEAYADYIYDNSSMTTFDGLVGGDASADAAAEFVAAVEPLYEHASRYAYRNPSNVPDIERWYRPYVKALMEWDRERAFFPDANLTLRVAYGKVAGYEYADGEYHRPQNHVGGHHRQGQPPISTTTISRSRCATYTRRSSTAAGASISTRAARCPYASSRRTIPLAVTPGSPVLNGRGELIGINFDRTWLSTMSDVEFDEDMCRNIIVDIRYVLFVIDRIGGAGYLLDEMRLK